MDRVTDRALVEVRRDADHNLVVVSATAAAAALLGAARETLPGSLWGPQFVAADAAFVLEGCRSVLDRRRRAWTGAAQPASRAGRCVHVTATRPVGSVRSRLQVELIEAAPRTPTVGSTDTDASPDEQWFAHRVLKSVRNPATAQAITTAIDHELRTPLTSILGYAEVLLDESVGDLTPLQTRMVTRVERNGQRLLKTVEDLLTLQAVRPGAFHLTASASTDRVRRRAASP